MWRSYRSVSSHQAVRYAFGYGGSDAVSPGGSIPDGLHEAPAAAGAAPDQEVTGAAENVRSAGALEGPPRSTTARSRMVARAVRISRPPGRAGAAFDAGAGQQRHLARRAGAVARRAYAESLTGSAA